MSLSRRWGPILLLGLSYFTTPVFAKGNSELHFFYWSFNSNLGLNAPGVRYGRKHVELTVDLLAGLGVNIAVYQNFNEQGRVIPRLSLGTQIYGSSGLIFGQLSIIPGLGVTFPLFKLFGGKAGIGWDYYLYFTRLEGSFAFTAFMPLTLAYYF